DIRSWIWMPAKMEIYASSDGINYNLIATISNTTEVNNYDIVTKQFIAGFSDLQTQYIKIKAINFGTVPAWHEGAGGKTWIFCDEVMVE
ncbi:MAG: beta-N-acetylhexosaminidase, partial [Fimbriimonadaceae bacterium]|nr:beta-N-acetylhexosaminidase [Chitinophagales bacterium]